MTEKLAQMAEIFKGFDRKTFPLPRIIHLETRSKCNGQCDFCPASIQFSKDRPDIRMPEELFQKIITELGELNYSGRISFYNNNEPFLDDRIYGFVESARKKLPRAYLEIKSNGLVLNTDKVLKAFNAGLDTLYINDYSTDQTLHPNIVKVQKELKTMRRFKGHYEVPTYFSRIIITKRQQDIQMGTRAGNSPNKQLDSNPLHRPCLRPCEMMTVSPEGVVSVCSEDYHYGLRKGNAAKQSMHEIWTSDDWLAFRRKLLSGDRSCAKECSGCDFKGSSFEIFQEYGLLDQAGTQNRSLLGRIKRKLSLGG